MLRPTKMAERVLSSAGVEEGWDGMMRRGACHKKKKRWVQACKIWRRIGLAGPGKERMQALAHSRSPGRPLMPRLHSSGCLGHNAASRRVSCCESVTLTIDIDGWRIDRGSG